MSRLARAPRGPILHVYSKIRARKQIPILNAAATRWLIELSRVKLTDRSSDLEKPGLCYLPPIIPDKGPETNHVTNGLLLRADIHTLFDLGLITIDKNYEVRIDDQLKARQYEELEGNSLRLPEDKTMWPSLEALEWQRKESNQ